MPPPRWVFALVACACLGAWSLASGTRPLHLVVELSNRGFRVTLPVAWAVLALDVLLVAAAFAAPRYRRPAGAVVGQTAWLFGATAWMISAPLCLFVGGARWFVAGLLLLGVGMVPLGIYVGLVGLGPEPIVLSLLAMTLSALGAWYTGRRLRRSDPPAVAVPSLR